MLQEPGRTAEQRGERLPEPGPQTREPGPHRAVRKAGLPGDIFTGGSFDLCAAEGRALRAEEILRRPPRPREWAIMPAIRPAAAGPRSVQAEAD